MYVPLITAPTWGTGRGDYLKYGGDRMDNRQHYATGSLEACCGNSRCHWVLVTAEAGSTSRQEGLRHLGLATLNALCKSWCESSSCGQKSTKQTPIRFEEERRTKPQTPVALTCALQPYSSSLTSKGTNRKGAPWGGRG